MQDIELYHIDTHNTMGWAAGLSAEGDWEHESQSMRTQTYIHFREQCDWYCRHETLLMLHHVWRQWTSTIFVLPLGFSEWTDGRGLSSQPGSSRNTLALWAYSYRMLPTLTTHTMIWVEVMKFGFFYLASLSVESWCTHRSWGKLHYFKNT